MAAITKSPAGGAISYQAASGGGDYYVNSGREMLHVRNAGGSPITVSLARQSPCNQGVTHGTTDVAVPAGADRLVSSKDPAIYNDPNGRVQVTYSGVTDITVGCIS